MVLTASLYVHWYNELSKMNNANAYAVVLCSQYAANLFVTNYTAAEIQWKGKKALGPFVLYFQV